MSSYDDGIEVRGRSRKEIRRSARLLRNVMGFSVDEEFPVMKFLEMVLPEMYPDFVLEVASRKEMGNKHGETFPDKHVIRLREDVYNGACSGNGRDLYTVAHEIGHFFLHSGEYSFARKGKGEIPRYKNSEWQAEVFAAELMMPFEAIRNMNPNDVVRVYGVSREAARVQCEIVRGELMGKRQN